MLTSYVALDLETTGLSPKHDRIIEIGAVKVIDGAPVEHLSRMVNPGRRLEERITELTGITDRDLVGAPCIEQLLPEVMAFLGELPLLGHRILFDYSFLKKAAVDVRRPFEKQGVDTLRIARRYLPDPFFLLRVLCDPASGAQSLPRRGGCTFALSENGGKFL